MEEVPRSRTGASVALAADPHRDRRFDIEGHDLGYPTRFHDGSSIMGLFAVPRRAAEDWLVDVPFTPAEVLPRRAVCSINAVHYTDTECGTYDEIAVAVFVERVTGGSRIPWVRLLRDAVRADLPSHTWRLGVTTTLSRDCGRRMWGFPKTMEDLRWTRSGGRAEMRWTAGDDLVLSYSVPAVGRRSAAPISPPVYSVFEGAPHVGELTQAYTGVGYHVRGARLEIGDHPKADPLRPLAGRRPLLAVWNEHLEFEMSAPRPLDGGP